jgi:poly-gamma-glutamate synthesis protein (capsule biosynthesis protein)
MKKRNLILLSVICVLTLVFLCGLLVAAFKIQEKRDRMVSQSNQEAVVTPEAQSEGDSTGSEENDENGGASDISPSAGASAEGGASSSDNAAEDTAVTPEGNAQAQDKSPEDTDNAGYPIVLGFAGDVNFNESSKPAAKYDSENKGILGGLSSELVDEMKAANIMMVNNEFAYSTRGSALPDKSYTFRANPKRVDILHEMGVDIVSLANNHALDYGQDALADTFSTLEKS